MSYALREPYVTTLPATEESMMLSHWTDSNTSTRRNSTGSLSSNYHLRSGSLPKVRDEESQLPNETQTQVVTNRPQASKLDNERNHTLVDPYSPDLPKLPLTKRLKHFTWAWYTLPMSTGGLALLIASQPKQFSGLMQIGTAVYSVNLLLFLSITITMIVRFRLYPGTFTKSLKHPREGFFFPTFFLATATIITSTDRYIIPHGDKALAWAIQGIYWAYVLLTLALALGQYSFIFGSHSYGLHTMMPTWILPIFPIMLSGTISSVIAGTQPEISVLPVVISGLTCQGLGIFVSCFMYAHMIGRLMQAGLPSREHRPGLFMCVGPPAFTALALIGMANSLPKDFNPDGDKVWMDSGIIQTFAVLAAVFLWALSLWWLGIGIIAVARAPPKHFHLGRWATVFPNTGFTLATISIANELGNDAILWFTTGMSIIMLSVYLFVLGSHIRAVITQEIMYPGRDEDVEEV